MRNLIIGFINLFLERVFSLIGNPFTGPGQTKICIFLLGITLAAYTGGGDITGGNELKPILDRFEPYLVKMYCPERLDELNVQVGFEVLEEYLVEEGHSLDILEGVRNEKYAERRIARVIQFAPVRCRGKDGVSAKDLMSWENR